MLDPQSAYQPYLLGITLRSRSVAQRCHSLLTRDFASEGPKKLALALASMADYLGRVAIVLFDQISWDDESAIEADFRQIQSIDALLREFASHLRYVHGAQSERVPWSTIPALESFFRQFAPKTRFILRPKWNYNYTATTEDIRQHYRESLAEFEGYLPEVSIDREVLRELDEPLHLIAFPALERDNIVLHSLLGHELGHYFVGDLSKIERENEFKLQVQQEIEVATIAELRLEGQSVATAGELFYRPIYDARLRWNMALAWKHYRRALEELLADAISVLVFGPAALLSMFEIAMQEDLDQIPLLEYGLYPPWRWRLRAALTTLDGQRNSLLPIDASIFPGNQAEKKAQRANTTLHHIRGLAQQETDRKLLRTSPIALIVYARVEQHLGPAVVQVMEAYPAFKEATAQLSSRAFRQQVRGLIERLEHGITPNAIEQSLDDRTETPLAAILNAASLYRVSLDTYLEKTKPLSEQVALKLRRRADRLTLKAIESADLAAEYWKKKRSKSRRDDARKADGETAGANLQANSGTPSKAELRAWLQKPHLPDRLVVTPLLEPDEAVGDGSIDVRLGNQFLVFKQEAFSALDIGQLEELNLECYQEHQIKAFGEKFILHPQQLVIGSTLEYIQVPRGLMCYVIGKSTWGRMGLIIATATKVDPGYRGCITLEIINEGEVPLVLYPGVPIAQLVFHHTAGGEGYQGGYSFATGPEFPDFMRKKDSWAFWTKPRRR